MSVRLCAPLSISPSHSQSQVTPSIVWTHSPSSVTPKNFFRNLHFPISIPAKFASTLRFSSQSIKWSIVISRRKFFWFWQWFCYTLCSSSILLQRSRLVFRFIVFSLRDCEIFVCNSLFDVSLFRRQEGKTCITNRNCDGGLHCETCFADGNVRPRCTRIQPISPISMVCISSLDFVFVSVFRIVTCRFFCLWFLYRNFRSRLIIFRLIITRGWRRTILSLG